MAAIYVLCCHIPRSSGTNALHLSSIILVFIPWSCLNCGRSEERFAIVRADHLNYTDYSSFFRFFMRYAQRRQRYEL